VVGMSCSASQGLTDYSPVEMLGGWYEAINCGVGEEPSLTKLVDPTLVSHSSRLESNTEEEGEPD